MVQKAWKLSKRNEHQMERAHVRDVIHAGMHDPDLLLELGGMQRYSRRPHSTGTPQKVGVLHERQRMIRAELKSIKDLGTFIRGMSRSKTLHATIALGYFRHVLQSGEYAADHRYMLAIREALEDPVLAKIIQRKWEAFDREFPGGALGGW